MDSSLWDPPIYEDDTADFKGNSQSDFPSGLGRDVIEEDAINERCCIEVLKKLIPKADAEIKELEEEIIFLQAQVALEDDAWAKICFDTLTERIKVLDISIRRLKNEKAQQQLGQGSSSQTRWDPAKHKKPQTENELNFCFQADGDPAKIESLQTEDDLDSYIRTCKDPSQNQKLQLEHEMGALYQTHVEPAQIENRQAEHELDFKFQTNRDPAQDETLQMDHDIGVPHHKHGEPAPKLSEILKALLEKYYFPNRDKQSSSFNAENLPTLQSTDETNLSNAEAIGCAAKSLEEISVPTNLEVPKNVEEKSQNGDTTIINSFPNFSEHASEVSTKRKMTEIDSSIEIGHGIGIHDSTTKAEKRMYAPYIQKEPTALMMDASANALSHITGSSSGTVGCVVSAETSGAVTVQSFGIENTELKPSPNPTETIITETDIDMSMFELEDIASVCMTDSVQQKAEESFSKQKLKMIADTDITDWIEEFPLMMKQEDSWLSDFECAFGESSSELFSSMSKEARKTLVEGQDPLHVHHSGGVGTKLLMSNFLKSTIPQLPNMPFPIFESGLLSESPPSAVSLNSAYQSPGTRKKYLLFPVITKGEELSSLQATQSMQEGRMKALAKDEINPTSNFHAANEFGVNKSLKLLSCTAAVATINLESLPMAQLKAMAKERKLKRYSKLNKSDLIKLLEESL